MKIIPIHYKISKPVKNYKEIKLEAGQMKIFMACGKFEGFYNKAYSIAHCQVSETPMAFFVLAPEVIKEKMFESEVIFNPQIISAKEVRDISQDKKTLDKMGVAPEVGNANKLVIPNVIEYQEPCMSFPFRKPKKVKRYNWIKVSYEIPGFFGLKRVERELEGIASEIFQHEFDHLQGKNIYFESESPVKWWELIGTEKSKGGTSLDNPEELGLNRAKEKAVN